MTIRWSGHDGEGNTVTGSVPVTVTPRPIQVPPEFYDGTDATSRLVVWLSARGPGEIVQFDPTRDLLCQTEAKITGRQHLEVRDVGIVRTAPELLRPDGTRTPGYVGAHLWFYQCPNLKVTGRYRVRSTNIVTESVASWPGFGAYNAAKELAAALRVESSPGLRVTAKLDVDGVWGDCIQLNRSDDFEIVLDPSGQCDRNGRQGITPLGLGGKVTGFRLLHGRRSGFDLEPYIAARMCGDLEISDYDVTTRLLPFASGGQGPVDNVYIHDGKSAGAAVPVFSINASDSARRANWRIERHTSVNGLGSPQAAVLAANVDGFSITDCRIPVSSARSRLTVEMRSCGGQTTIMGNDFVNGTLVRNTTPRPDQVLALQSDQQIV